MKRLFLFILALTILTGQALAQSSVSDIKKRGVLRVGSEIGYIPFEMKAKNGELMGFDMSVAAFIAERLGVKLEVVDTPWDSLIQDLGVGKFDLLMSGMTITSERRNMVDFSTPYIASGQTILLNKNKENIIKGFRDINHPDITIISKKGTTAADLVSNFFTKAKVVLYDDTEEDIVKRLLKGEADLFVYDYPYLAMVYQDHSDKTVFLSDPFTYEPFGIGVKKGNTDLLDYVNASIKDMKSKGEYEKIRKFWLEGNSWKSKM